MPTLPFALALLTAPLPGVPARALPTLPQAGRGLSVLELLHRSADGDRDGNATAAEWAGFLDGLGADAGGRIDPSVARAAALDLDLDGDGRLAGADLDGLFAELDRDGDGALSAPEASPTGRRGSGGFAIPARTLLRLLVVAGADADADGAVSAEEWRALRDAAGAGDAPLAVVAGWIRRLDATASQERALFNPAVLFGTVDAELDLDRDGKITLDDLRAVHARMDADADGAVSAAEIAALAAGASGGALPRPEAPPPPEPGRERPPLMPWQRTLDDALAVVGETGKPLLICVNMDDEPASDSLARTRYRDPAFVELVRGFVPVLASPDTHEPLERDDRGRRLPDPRFGRLVCSEHVAIEPALFERYFSDKRYAPRHVGVAPDGTVLFDVYLVQDLSVIDDVLAKHGRPPANPPAEPATLDEGALLASADAACREELERRFVVSDEAARLRLAAAALAEARAVQHPELLHLALRDPSEAVRLAGVRAMAEHPERMPLELGPTAFLASRADPTARAALLAAFPRAGGDATRSARGRRLALVLGTLDQPSALLDPHRWRLAYAAAPAAPEPPPDPAEQDALAEALDGLQAELERSPDDVETAVQLAAAWLRFGRVQIAAGQNPLFVLEDATRSARRALELDPDEPRALGILAWASYLASDLETAADAAERALPGLLRDASSTLAAEVLNAFVQARTSALYEALGAEGGPSWPARWIPDLRAAHETLLAHPSATEAHAVLYLRLLGTLEAWGAQADAVRAALVRWPASGDLHTWLRFQLLRDGGAAALEDAYEAEPLATLREASPAMIDWFHGLATFVAAEQDVRMRRPDEALAAYERSDQRFARATEEEPGFAGSAGHYQALASAGRARLHLDAGRLAEAADAIEDALAIAPGSAETADGLGRTPIETARAIAGALERAGDEARARELRDRLPARTAASDG